MLTVRGGRRGVLTVRGGEGCLQLEGGGGGCLQLERGGEGVLTVTVSIDVAKQQSFFTVCLRHSAAAASLILHFACYSVQVQ